jgi:predicted unusual protein kinase regulating ubiquinone biosynthesis (AarF/ABC1/UbiB family)
VEVHVQIERRAEDVTAPHCSARTPHCRRESAMVRAFQELGFETKTGDDRTLLLIARRMLSRSEAGAFEGEFTEEMTDDLLEAIREDPVVKVPSDFVLVGRVFAFLAEIAHTLGSRANVLAAMGAGPPS